MLLVANTLLGFALLSSRVGKLCAWQGSSCCQIIFPEVTKPPGSQSLSSPLLRLLAVC